MIFNFGAEKIAEALMVNEELQKLDLSEFDILSPLDIAETSLR